MKETSHPLSGRVLGARAALIPALISLSDFALGHVGLPEGLHGTFETLSQVAVVLITEAFVYKFVVALNEWNRKKQIRDYDAKREKLVNRLSLPSLSDKQKEKTQVTINQLDDKLLQLHVSSSDFKMKPADDLA